MVYIFECKDTNTGKIVIKNYVTDSSELDKDERDDIVEDLIDNGYEDIRNIA